MPGKIKVQEAFEGAIRSFASRNTQIRQRHEQAAIAMNAVRKDNDQYNKDWENFRAVIATSHGLQPEDLWEPDPNGNPNQQIPPGKYWLNEELMEIIPSPLPMPEKTNGHNAAADATVMEETATIAEGENDASSSASTDSDPDANRQSRDDASAAAGAMANGNLPPAKARTR